MAVQEQPAPEAGPEGRGTLRIEAVGSDIARASEVLAGFYAGRGWSVAPTEQPFSYRYAALGDPVMTLRTSQMRGRAAGEDPAGGDYVVQWLVEGRAIVDVDRGALPMRRGVPQLNPAHRPFVFSYTDYDQKLVHLGRERVAGVARERGYRSTGALRFDHLRRVTPEASARWHGVVGEISTAVRTGRVTTLLWDRLTRRAAAAFLELYPPEGAALPEVLLAPRNGSIRAAVEFVHESAHLPIGPVEIAAAAHLSVRGTQVAFRRLLGTTPLQYLRDVRLDRVRADLRLGDPRSATVADVARRWGFGHLGRFAGAYTARFGEYPSTTLDRG
ncbi:AraC family transcriptional regulator [Rathayibacter sp. VKM Ac-2760]|uniref:helix-turn-helix transcriptional regulator n=1 Tax=Rathayibacter sp. VKM Ac-2760 TaxID=2609253 RepID=UPI00131864B4|nr:AraC family transcriptional regulator [Rathayibacter sp. VKM Ac-2760]QHC58900.1 helix-turn-helix domain-containing protein [Rathayibacter sp. VKM Ac-2760]